jgi:D-aminopeptidase
MPVRAADLGIRIGLGRAGPLDAITDVAGVKVGHVTLIEGDGPLVVGRGPVRTGVTVIAPHAGDVRREPVFAGCHRLNGNGELTGLEFIREYGLLTTPIALTNTHSVGVVRDALVAASVDPSRPGAAWWSLPVVGETWDGLLNDIDGFHVRAEHLQEALVSTRPGEVAQGAVGGGTGMICYEFKGGIGTASRVIDEAEGGWTVGALVQANHGRRPWLRVDGVPVGEAIPTTEIPAPATPRPAGMSGPPPVPPGPPPGSGSIIVVLATDAPLLPHQCDRLAQRAGLGLARTGGTGGTTSGDLFLAFATGNRFDSSVHEPIDGAVHDVRMTGERSMDALFGAAIEATEEAIVNALLNARTMTGRDGITARALPHDRLVDVMRAYGRSGAGRDTRSG